MTIVVDASITLAWCLEDEHSDAADAVLTRVRADGALAPPIWPLEVANSLLAAERRGRVTSGEIPDVVKWLRQLPIAIDPSDPSLHMDALIVMGRDGSLSVYDASYLHLAIRTDLPLATLDGRLRSALEQMGGRLLDI